MNEKAILELEESKRDKVLTELKSMYGTYKRLYHDFREIVDHDVIKTQLREASIETAGRNYINKHGIEHGLTVAHNMLYLFKFIEKDIVEPAYVKAPELTKEHALFVLLVAAYIHDVGRFYDPVIDHEREISGVLEILRDLARPAIIKLAKDVEIREGLIRRIRELCLCHDQKDKESGKVEIALIKLADALDCDKNRVYSEIEKPKELKADHPTKMRTILSKDKQPEKYFGSFNIDKIEIEWVDKENVLEITVFINNYAASTAIKTILKVLAKCEQSKEPVERLSRRIRVYIKDKEDGGHHYIVYPQDVVRIPYAKIINSSYTFIIKNMNGDTDIEDMFEIKNLSDKAGISSHTKSLGGYKKTSWEELEGKINFIDSKDRKLDKVYRYTECNPKTGVVSHIWTVIFKDRLQIEDNPLKIKGFYSSWPGFTNVKKDMHAHKLHTPADHLEVKIIFPSEKNIEQEKIKTCIEIENSEGVLYHSNKIPTFSYDKEGKLCLTSTFDMLKPGYTYITKWELVNMDTDAG